MNKPSNQTFEQKTKKERKQDEFELIVKNVLDSNKQKLHLLQSEALKVSLQLNEINEEIQQTMKFIIDIHERGIDAVK